MGSPAAPQTVPAASQQTGAGNVIAGMSDWASAGALYLVCLWLAETPAAPLAVALAWATAIVVYITADPLASLLGIAGKQQSVGALAAQIGRSLSGSGGSSGTGNA